MLNKNKHAVKLGKLGGTATAKKMTKEQRKERSINALKARWGKRNEQTNKTTNSTG